MPKKCFYITFGLAHPLRDRVQRILVRDNDDPLETIARETARSFYGDKWAAIYGPFNVHEGANGVVIAGEEYRLIDHDLTAGEVYQ